MQEIWIWSPGWEDFLEEGRQLTPAFLPGKCHGQRSLARQQSTGSQRVGHNWAPEHARTHTHAPNYDVENGIPGELELPNNKFGSIRSKHIYTSNHDVENDMPRGLTLPNNKFSLIQNKHIHTPNYDVGNGIPGRLELPNNKFGLIQNKECHLLKDHLAL